MKHLKTKTDLNESLKNQNISDVHFIFNSLRNKLDEQENSIVEYMNKYMTQVERNKHGDNIYSLLVRSQGLIAQISLEMLSDGRKNKIDRVKNLKQFLNENISGGYTMYTGISLKQRENVWRDKNLTDRETNVTDDKSFAFDYSYDFTTGKYDDVIVEISNIPLDAFVAYRVENVSDEYYDEEGEEETYSDDDDFHSMNNMTDDKKKNIIDNYSLFIVSLYKYKGIISTKLIRR